MSDEVREQFLTASSDASSEVLAHDLVKEVIKEQYGNITGNHGAEPAGLTYYGLSKIAAYAAQVARAHALGFDPELLRLTEDEATEKQIELMKLFANAGKQTYIAIVPEKEET